MHRYLKRQHPFQLEFFPYPRLESETLVKKREALTTHAKPGTSLLIWSLRLINTFFPSSCFHFVLSLICVVTFFNFANWWSSYHIAQVEEKIRRPIDQPHAHRFTQIGVINNVFNRLNDKNRYLIKWSILITSLALSSLYYTLGCDISINFVFLFIWAMKAIQNTKKGRRRFENVTYPHHVISVIFLVLCTAFMAHVD